MNQNLHINTRDFVRREDIIREAVPLSIFSRVLEDLPDQETVVNWSVRGQKKGLRQFLDVQVQTCPILICQRCLKPFEYLIESQVVIELVDSEELLDVAFSEQDLSEESSEFERLVHDSHFDVYQLIEDELILSIPYIPKHESCIELAVEQEEKESPFAVLEKLKH